MYAYGGKGGNGYSGANGGGGGAGLAVVNLTAKQVNATVNAAGGSSSADTSLGVGGAARANLVANATAGQASAMVDVHGGGGSAPGGARAKSRAQGTSGSFSAEADSGFKGPADGLLVTAVQANASGTTDGKDKAQAKTSINATPSIVVSSGTTVAFVTGMPASASAEAVLTGNTNIKTAFGASPTFFAMTELGGEYSTGGTKPQTIAASISFDVDTTKLATKGDLIVGFYDPVSVGASFTSLVFTLEVPGGATLISKTFTSVTAANAFFTDDAMNLGAIGSGSLTGSSLNLVASITLVTSGTSQGYYFQMIAGDPPASAPHAATARFAQAMSTVGASLTSAMVAQPNAPPFTPLMTMATSLPLG